MANAAGNASFERPRKVRERLLRATAALDEAKVPYAVIGGHAVAEWVTEADQGGTRVTPDVDILLERGSFERAKAALERAGFHHKPGTSIVTFLDGPTAKSRDSVHIIFAGEFVRPEDLLPAARFGIAKRGPDFDVVLLDALVLMKLTSYRLKDKVHLRDMIDVGLIDYSWLTRVPESLADRLKIILDTPDG